MNLVQQVDRSALRTDPEHLAFVLMMTKLNGCMTLQFGFIPGDARLYAVFDSECAPLPGISENQFTGIVYTRQGKRSRSERKHGNK